MLPGGGIRAAQRRLRGRQCRRKKAPLERYIYPSWSGCFEVAEYSRCGRVSPANPWKGSREASDQSLEQRFKPAARTPSRKGMAQAREAAEPHGVLSTTRRMESRSLLRFLRAKQNRTRTQPVFSAASRAESTDVKLSADAHDVHRRLVVEVGLLPFLKVLARTARVRAEADAYIAAHTSKLAPPKGLPVFTRGKTRRLRTQPLRFAGQMIVQKKNCVKCQIDTV